MIARPGHRGNRRRQCIVAVTAVFLSMTAFAGAAPAERDSLTLEQAVALALQRNPELQLARNSSRSSEITVKRRRGVFLPDLNVNSSGSHQAGKSVDPVSGDYTASAYTRFSLNVSSSLTLFDGFYNASALQQARKNRDAAAADLTRTLQDVVYTVIQQFVQSITARSFVAVEQENLAAQQRLLDQITAFFHAGRKPVTDVYQQQAEIAASEYRLHEADRSRQVALINLQQSLGVDPEPAMKLIEPPVEDIIARLRKTHGDAPGSESTAERPDITAQENRVAAARQSVRLARSGYYPRLSATAGVGSSYSSAIPESDLGDQLLDRNLSASLSLSLAIPLFDRGQTRQDVASAKIQLSSVQVDLERQRRQAAAEIREARLNWDNAGQQLVSAAKSLKYARAALESIEDRYRANAATLAEVSQSRAQYRQARYNHVAAGYTLLLRGLEIFYSRGDGEGLMAMINAARAAQGEEE